MVASLMADVRPDLVVTFGPHGPTGHDDHRAVSRWVTKAWQAAHGPAALWYAALPPGFRALWGELCADRSVWMDEAPTESPAPADLMHLQVCPRPLLDRKFAALGAHRSQTAALNSRVGAGRYGDWWCMEAFVAATAAEAEEAA